MDSLFRLVDNLQIASQNVKPCGAILDAYHPLNLQFHDTLVEFAGNQKLLHTYRRLVNELNLFRRHT